MKELSESDIQGLVQKWLRESLDTMESYRVDAPVHSPDAIRDVQHDLEKAENSYREALGRGDYSRMEHYAERVLHEHGIAFNRKSSAFRKLCRELLKAAITNTQIEQQRSRGEYDEDLPVPSKVMVAPEADAAPSSVESAISISKLFD